VVRRRGVGQKRWRLVLAGRRNRLFNRAGSDHLVLPAQRDADQDFCSGRRYHRGELERRDGTRIWDQPGRAAYCGLGCRHAAARSSGQRPSHVGLRFGIDDARVIGDHHRWRRRERQCRQYRRGLPPCRRFRVGRRHPQPAVRGHGGRRHADRDAGGRCHPRSRRERHPIGPGRQRYRLRRCRQRYVDLHIVKLHDRRLPFRRARHLQWRHWDGHSGFLVYFRLRWGPARTAHHAVRRKL
jgi:hypothetical protein